MPWSSCICICIYIYIYIYIFIFIYIQICRYMCIIALPADTLSSRFNVISLYYDYVDTLNKLKKSLKKDKMCF